MKQHIRDIDQLQINQMAERVLSFLASVRKRVLPSGPNMGTEAYIKAYDIARDLVADYEGSHQELVDVTLQILEVVYLKSGNWGNL